MSDYSCCCGLRLDNTRKRFRRGTLDKQLYDKTEYALCQIKEGKDIGVDILYSCMGKVMFAVARGVVHDAAWAEDIVHDSFL